MLPGGTGDFIAPFPSLAGRIAPTPSFRWLHDDIANGDGYAVGHVDVLWVCAEQRILIE